MSFGVTNALVVFMDYMNIIFWQCLDKFVVVFIDDILIYSKDRNEHDGHLKVVLKYLGDINYTGNYLNVSYGWVKYNFSACNLSSWNRGWPNKDRGYVQRGTPQTVTKVRSFLGLAGYYQQFVEGFSKIVSPLTQLTWKDKPFSWTT